jgi:hypothetical protein
MDGEEEDGPGIVVGGGSVTMHKFNKRPKGQLRKKRADSDDEAKDRSSGVYMAVSSMFSEIERTRTRRGQ